MANNRIAYGLLKKLGYETDGMTPEQAWKALNGVPIEKLQAALRQDSAEVSSLPSTNKIVENYERQFGTIKMTPEQKIASVHIVIGQDNILPELNEEDLSKIGVKRNKPVLVKANIVDRNATEHSDVAFNEINNMVGQTLYGNGHKLLRGKYPDKPYYVFYKAFDFKDKKGNTMYGTVILDVTEQKDCFEVVHWHWVNEPKMKGIVPNFKK